MPSIRLELVGVLHDVGNKRIHMIRTFHQQIINVCSELVVIPFPLLVPVIASDVRRYEIDWALLEKRCNAQDNQFFSATAADVGKVWQVKYPNDFGQYRVYLVLACFVAQTCTCTQVFAAPHYAPKKQDTHIHTHTHTHSLSLSCRNLHAQQFEPAVFWTLQVLRESNKKANSSFQPANRPDIKTHAQYFSQIHNYHIPENASLYEAYPFGKAARSQIFPNRIDSTFRGQVALHGMHNA